MIIPRKEYENPPSGLHNGILADITDVFTATTTYQGQTKSFPAVYFIWILAYLGKNGKPLQVRRRYNVSNFHEKSNVYKDLKTILGHPPNVAADLDTYLGTVCKLWINTEKSPDGLKEYANIQGYLPYEQGSPMPIIPPDFVRDKFKPKIQAGPNGQPVQTYAHPPQAQPVQAVAQARYNPPSQPTQQSQQWQPAPPVQGADVTF